MPFTSKKLTDMLRIECGPWNNCGDIEKIPAGHKLNKPSLLFSNIDDDAIEAQMKKLKK